MPKKRYRPKDIIAECSDLTPMQLREHHVGHHIISKVDYLVFGVGSK